MKPKLAALLLGGMLVFAASGLCWAEVEWDIINTLKLDATPVDMSVSEDGRTIYILADDGFIYIYSASGMLTDKIKVGKQIDQIKVGPEGEFLFTSSRKNKAVQVIDLKFVYQINTDGSPAKGPADAPVVIAVFSDFQ